MAEREKQSPEELEALMRKIDLLYPSPSDRASKIHRLIQEQLPDATNWDVICFCVEYLGYMSVQPELMWLKNVALLGNKLVYKAHYLMHEEYLKDQPLRSPSTVEAEVLHELRRGSTSPSPKESITEVGEEAARSGIIRRGEIEPEPEVIGSISPQGEQARSELTGKARPPADGSDEAADQEHLDGPSS